jgi:hypothetical protein
MQGWMSLLSPSTPSQRTSSFGSKSRFQSTSNGFTGGRCRKPGYSGGSRHSLPAAQASVNSPCDSVVNNQRIQNTALIYTPAGQPCVHPAKLPNLQKPYPYLILYRLPYPVSCLPYPRLRRLFFQKQLPNHPTTQLPNYPTTQPLNHPTQSPSSTRHPRLWRDFRHFVPVLYPVSYIPYPRLRRLFFQKRPLIIHVRHTQVTRNF